MSEDTKSLPSTRIRVFVAAAIGHYFNDSLSVAFPMLIIYYSRAGISLGYLGLMAALYGIISALASEPIGRLADRWARKGILMSLGIAALGSSLILFSVSFAFISIANFILLPASILLGLGLAFYHPIGGSIIADATEKKSTSLYLGINGSIGSIGRALFPTILVLFIEISGSVEGTLYLAVIVLISAALIFSLTSRLGSKVKESQSEIRKVGLKEYTRFIFSLTFVFFLRSVFTGSIMTYMPKYFANAYGSLVGVIITIIYITPIIGQPLLGHLTDRVGGRNIVILTSLISVASFGIFLLNISYLTKVVLMMIFSFATFSGFPIMMGYTSQVLPRNILTRANGILWGFGTTIGTAIGAGVGGLIADQYGIYTTFLVLWFVGLFSVVSLPLLPKAGKKEVQ
ncbi:MAG: MFS transporter [Conexivisphaerales archaeon]